MLPNTVSIGGLDWTVKLRDGLRENEKSLGMCNKDRLEIHIDNALNAEQQKATLIHESLHAMCYMAGIDEDVKITEEEFCTRIEFFLFTFIRDNAIL